MKNKDIRILLLENDIKLWELAKKYGCSDSTLSKMLRNELDVIQKKEIIYYIEQLINK